MRPKARALAKALASAFLSGDWERSEMLRRGSVVLGGGGIPLREIVDAALRAFTAAPHDARDALAQLIGSHAAFSQLRALKIHHLLVDAPMMRPARWPVQPLHTLRDLTEWLRVDNAQLDWFADRRGFNRKAIEPKLWGYRYQWVHKCSGGVRLLEAPKQRLKSIQRQVLSGILEALPPHPAAHGFRKGRGVLSHAQLHVGREVVLRFDLRAFFASVNTGRAYGVFRAAGYPEEVARTLIGLCTARVPYAVLRAAPRPADTAGAHELAHLRAHLRDFHLPQGAPTSPALANLCAYGLDVRLNALAERLGATYSRYADDLTFSGEKTLGSNVRRIQQLVAEIARDDGFAINERKTRVMRRSQRQEVTGVVVNAHVNAGRAEFDALKATLHNCVVRGPSSQARGVPRFREVLQGRLAWAEQLNPDRAARLRADFERIDWAR